MPTDLNDAGLLYKPGNAVQLEGELDCVVVERRERGGVASATVQRLRKQWQERESASDEEHSACLRQLRRLSDAPRWRVLAGHIEAVGEAEAITEREARALRREVLRGRAHTPDTALDLPTNMAEA